MKKVFLTFYSAGNFGDDFFIKIIGDYFKNVEFLLIINPKYKIKNLPENVRILKISSWIITILNKLCSLTNGNSKFKEKYKKILEKCVTGIIQIIQQHVAAVVRIGGSIFIEHSEKDKEIDFSISPKENRDYSIKCKVKKNNSKEFIIGANFGPYYGESHLHYVENLFKENVNVCLRDYSSYMLFKHLDNVQYAPDTVFIYKPNEITKNNTGSKRVFISMINPLRSVREKKVAEHYYSLILETIKTLQKRGFVIDLVSFCNNEGDKYAIEKVYNSLISTENVYKHYYSGDIDEILGLVAQSDFVIGTRFHSIILGILYGKPTFPIAYSCKIVNYLLDLNFEGKLVCFNDIDKVNVKDVLYNYDNNYICACDDHKKYAENQFYALNRYLNNDFEENQL